MNARDENVPMNQEQINEVLSKQTAPKIHPEDLDAQVSEVQYLQVPGKTLIYCVITMLNGFTVTGESACADPDNFNEEVGKSIAFRNAKDKMWSLLGYELKTRLHKEAGSTFLTRLKDEAEQLEDRTKNLSAFMNSATFSTLDPENREDLFDQHKHMREYLKVLKRRIRKLG
ncbi:hypothetical protein PP742_gp06 [Alcaligenes phage vB_Af_QDWS595]|uniref:Uncharacterized protein n=1 Tax=Alcaligenes phage vB_Af_QDWS595 TaxID=2877946 RepID=A0AAE8Y361_9CAUD|nr:hypothetical protein PP742_gp06 [Alcaligenes phage vB_Af_QDWS595]UCR75490.1 hypothetical protein vBAfaPQDWS595_06 [Alcaligenes phage vB_Af_QDWS595]